MPPSSNLPPPSTGCGDLKTEKDWRSEVKKRKSVKARKARLDKAVRLLTDQGLAPRAPMTA